MRWSARATCSSEATKSSLMMGEKGAMLLSAYIFGLVALSSLSLGPFNIISLAPGNLDALLGLLVPTNEVEDHIVVLLRRLFVLTLVRVLLLAAVSRKGGFDSAHFIHCPFHLH